MINESFDIDYINLQTSRRLDQIGRGGFAKIFIFFRLYFEVLGVLLRKRYDYCYLTINAHGPAFYKEMVIVFLLKLFRLKPIYYYHMKGVSRFQDQWLPDKLYRYQFRKARTILLSPLIYHDIAKYAPEEQVFYCLEGIPDTTTKRTEEMIDRRLEKAAPEFLFLSNMMRAKGVFVLLEACRLLRQKCLQFKALFIGGAIDIDDEAFNAFALANDLQDHVSYLGPKYGKDKHEFFERVDVFVHPTLNDVQPLTILEALQYGIPVVSTDEGTIPDVIKDGETGYIVPKNDAQALADRIEKLLTDPALRLAMSRRARRHYEERFTVRKFEENFVRAMNQAIADFESSGDVEVMKKVNLPV